METSTKEEITKFSPHYEKAQRSYEEETIPYHVEITKPQMIGGHLYRPGTDVLKDKTKIGPKQAFVPNKPSKGTPRREQASDKRGVQRSATSPPSDKPQGYAGGSGGGAPGGRPPGKGPPSGNGDDGIDNHHEDDDDDEDGSDSFEELLKEEEKYLDKDQTKLKLGPHQTTVMISKKMYIVQPTTVEHKLGAPGGGTMPTHGMVSIAEGRGGPPPPPGSSGLAPGAIGPKGDNGDKEDKGDKGDKGDPGIQGPPGTQVGAEGVPIVTPNLDTTNLEQSFNGLSKSIQDIMEAQHDVSLSMQSIQAEHVNALKELTQTTQQGNFNTIFNDITKYDGLDKDELENWIDKIQLACKITETEKDIRKIALAKSAGDVTVCLNSIDPNASWSLHKAELRSCFGDNKTRVHSATQLNTFRMQKDTESMRVYIGLFTDKHYKATNRLASQDFELPTNS